MSKPHAGTLVTDIILSISKDLCILTCSGETCTGWYSTGGADNELD